MTKHIVQQKKRSKEMTKHIVAALSTVFCIVFSLSAADLMVAAGDELTISEDATYDTVTVYGKLTVSKGRKLTAGDMHVMPSGYLRLNGSTTVFSSVNASGDGSIIDQEESSGTHATVNVTGDGDSKMTQLGTAYTILNKSGAGTLTIAPRNAMHSLSVGSGKVIVQSRAAAGYRYYKFIVDECRTKSSTATQMDEMYWYDENGTDLSSTRTSPTGSIYGYQLYDRNTGTKWYQSGDKSGWTCTTAFPGARRIRSYIWNTANDEKGRDPSAWRVRGSLDNAIWQTIAQVTNFVASDTRNAPAAATNFPFSAPQIVTIPTVKLDCGATLEVGTDTTLVVTDFKSDDFGNAPSFCSLSITNGSVFAWNPSADKTLTFLGLSGEGAFRKDGPQTVTMRGEPLSVGSLHVSGGTLSLRNARCETRRFFKFGFKKSWWMTTHPDEDYSSNDRHKLQFSELALYDTKGRRVNSVSNVQNVKWPWGNNGSGLNAIFDESTSTYCYSTRIPGQTESVQFEVKAGVAESVAGYRFCSMYNYVYCDTMPGEWYVNASSDGENWERIDDKVCAGTGGTYWNAMNGGVPFVFTNAVENVAAVAPSCKVKIDGGATLDVSGTATKFANLAIDCSAASDATLIGGELAAAGEIALEGVSFQDGATCSVPLAFVGTQGLSRATDWTVVVNGKVSSNCYLSVADGRLTLCKKGFVLIVE